MRRPPAILLAVLAALAAGCESAGAPPVGPTAPAATAAKSAPPGAVVSPPPFQSLPDAPLEKFCGPSASTHCLSLTEYLTSLEPKECAASVKPLPSQRTCGTGIVVDVDYGIVGYSRYFDASGKLVGAVAHVYEQGGNQRYGAVPTCTPGDAKPACPPK